MNTSDLEGVKTKVCSKCKIEKPVDGFHKCIGRKDGLDFYCRLCKKEYRKANSDKIKEYKKEYYKTNSDKIKEYIKEYRKANSDKIKEYNKEYREANFEYIKEYRKANSDKIKESTKEYRKANSDKIKESTKEYRKANSDKIKEYKKEYAKDNPDKRNALQAKRRSKKLQATPPWLTKEHLSAIRDFYIESKTLEKATGIKHHVDHIVPLQGENVCGLHVPWNLQVLSASENLAKKNHYPDEWEDT